MALLERGHQVDIVERESRLLPLYFDMLAGGLVGEIFREAGGRLHAGQEAVEVQAHDGRLEVALSGGPSLEADLLVTAVGAGARTSFLASSGVKVYQGVVVDQYMRSSVPDIYAAGDVAEAPGFFGGRGINATLPSAVAQGKVAGAAMAGQPEPYEGWIPMNVFSFLGHRAFSVGLAIPPGDDFQVATVSDLKARSYGKLVARKGRLVGAVFLNGPADPGVFAYLVRQGAQLAPHLEALLLQPREVGHCLMQAALESEASLAR